MSTVKKIKANLLKVFHWGIPGIVNYIRNSLHRYHIKKQILSSMHHCMPTRGITVIGEFSQFGSPSKTLRDFVFALKEARIPFQTLDTTPPQCSKIPPSDYLEIITLKEDFAIDKYDHIIENLPSIVPSEIKIPKARIAFWEFESGFLYGYPDITLSSDVIAMSDFNTDYFKKILPETTSVSKILYPFNYKTQQMKEPSLVRKKYGIGDEDFVVYFNFDFGAAFNRKNPDGAMRAFSKAFRSIPNAHLVFKTKSASSHSARVNELNDLAISLGIETRFTMINDHISLQEVFELVNACDVYLSLHRGEGFGMTLAEAMAMGKPVVCTDWSATTEFCKPECTIPVPYRLAPVKPEQIDHPYYEKVEEWAEPDIDAAADALLKLYKDPNLCIELGHKASVFIRNYFSVENFKESVETFLDKPQS
jgi:glycosyltransferase involved in cell wall biosynthesis